MAVLLALPLTAAARHQHHHDADESKETPARHRSPRPEASPVEVAQQALAAGDNAAAYQALEQAYRARPSAELLFWLGRVAEAEKRPIAAQDYMRRYLLETGADKSEAAAPLAAQAQQIVEQPSEGSAEVRVVGPKGGLLFLDDRLTGTLPLPGALLLATGQHRVAIETRRKRLDGKVEIMAGRGTEVLFDLEASAVLISQQPVVLVLRIDRGVAAADQARFASATQEAISKAHCSAVPAAEALRRAPNLRSCLSEVDCALRLADKNSLDYALRIELDSKPGLTPGLGPDTRISAAVLDVAVSAVAAQIERTCSGCSGEAVAAGLREAVAQVLEQGIGRPRGSLVIESDPAGAEVKIDGRQAGAAPLRRDVLAGEHLIELTAPNQKPASQRIRIEPSAAKTLRVMLAQKPPELQVPQNSGDSQEIEPAPSEPPKRGAAFLHPRPRWRLVVGGIAVGAGVVLAGLGSSALSVDGQCQTPAVPPMATCGYLFMTAGVGGGLLGAGLVLTLGGTGLLLWPGAEPRPESQPKLRPDLRSAPRPGQAAGLATGPATRATAPPGQLGAGFVPTLLMVRY